VIPFAAIPVGGCFFDEDGDLMMKTDRLINDDGAIAHMIVCIEPHLAGRIYHIYDFDRKYILVQGEHVLALRGDDGDELNA